MDIETLVICTVIAFCFGTCAVSEHDDAVTKRELESACITAHGDWADGHCHPVKQ